jgi:hypothetical protein
MPIRQLRPRTAERAGRQEKRFSLAAAAALLCLAVAACGQQPAAAPAGGGYTPGLGEIMTLQQMRHLKLWLAGEAGNWDLAVYESEELAEGFDDVVRLHPTHKDAPVAPRDAIPRIILAPLAQVRAAAENRDRAAFMQAYDTLTLACNNCHNAMNFGFNVIGRPTGNPYTNQVFELQQSTAETEPAP